MGYNITDQIINNKILSIICKNGRLSHCLLLPPLYVDGLQTKLGKCRIYFGKSVSSDIALPYSHDQLSGMFCHMACHQDHVADYGTQSAAMDFMISRIQTDKERFICDLTTQTDRLSQEIGCITLTMLFSFTKHSRREVPMTSIL